MATSPLSGSKEGSSRLHRPTCSEVACARCIGQNAEDSRMKTKLLISLFDIFLTCFTNVEQFIKKTSLNFRQQNIADQKAFSAAWILFFRDEKRETRDEICAS